MRVAAQQRGHGARCSCTAEPSIQGQAGAAGSPAQISAGTASSAETSICAVMAWAGCALAFTAAFQAACRTALSRAAAT